MPESRPLEWVSTEDLIEEIQLRHDFLFIARSLVNAPPSANVSIHITRNPQWVQTLIHIVTGIDLDALGEPPHDPTTDSDWPPRM